MNFSTYLRWKYVGLHQIWCWKAIKHSLRRSGGYDDEEEAKRGLKLFIFNPITPIHFIRYSRSIWALFHHIATDYSCGVKSILRLSLCSQRFHLNYVVYVCVCACSLNCEMRNMKLDRNLLPKVERGEIVAVIIINMNYVNGEKSSLVVICAMKIIY